MPKSVTRHNSRRVGHIGTVVRSAAASLMVLPYQLLAEASPLLLAGPAGSFSTTASKGIIIEDEDQCSL
jgi:hypothetical protein